MRNGTQHRDMGRMLATPAESMQHVTRADAVHHNSCIDPKGRTREAGGQVARSIARMQTGRPTPPTRRWRLAAGWSL